MRLGCSMRRGLAIGGAEGSLARGSAMGFEGRGVLSVARALAAAWSTIWARDDKGSMRLGTTGYSTGRGLRR